MPPWEGRRAVLLGGGPSLKGFDLDRLRDRGAIVVAINDAILHVPWADAAFTIDAMWLSNRRAEFLAFAGEKIAAVPDAWPAHEWPGVLCLKRRPLAKPSGLGTVFTGENSGFGALGLTLARGAAKIALLGYDMTAPGHWHAGYAWRSRYGHRDYHRWAAFFSVLAADAERRGATVINCNPRSAIRCFPFGRVEEVLCE